MNSVIRTGNNPTPVSHGASPSKKTERLRMLEPLRLSVPLKTLLTRPHHLRDPLECPIEFFP